ncbi:hypothetical protein D3C81_1515380 [compost metagenome]
MPRCIDQIHLHTPPPERRQGRTHGNPPLALHLHGIRQRRAAVHTAHRLNAAALIENMLCSCCLPRIDMGKDPHVNPFRLLMLNHLCSPVMS